MEPPGMETCQEVLLIGCLLAGEVYGRCQATQGEVLAGGALGVDRAAVVGVVAAP